MNHQGDDGRRHYDWDGTVVAVNVGGAVIPTLMSIYLLMKRELWVKGVVATAIVALVIHWMANPVPGLGIAVPVFLPVVVTAIIAMLLSREDAAPLPISLAASAR